MESLLVFREWRLFNRLRLWHSSRPWHEFGAVECRRQRSGEDPPQDIVIVSLRKHTGQFLNLRYFYAERNLPSTEANAFAENLAETMRLKLRAEVI